MSDQQTMRVVCLNIAQEYIYNQYQNEDTVEGIECGQLVYPYSLPIPPQQPYFEYIVQQYPHHKYMPCQQPLILGSNYFHFGGELGNNIIHVLF